MNTLIEEQETIIEEGDTDFKDIDFDSDLDDGYEDIPNSDDYYDDYTTYTTPKTARSV